MVSGNCVGAARKGKCLCGYKDQGLRVSRLSGKRFSSSTVEHEDEEKRAGKGDIHTGRTSAAKTGMKWCSALRVVVVVDVGSVW